MNFRAHKLSLSLSPSRTKHRIRGECDCIKVVLKQFLCFADSTANIWQAGPQCTPEEPLHQHSPPPSHPKPEQQVPGDPFCPRYCKVTLLQLVVLTLNPQHPNSTTASLSSHWQICNRKKLGKEIQVTCHTNKHIGTIG